MSEELDKLTHERVEKYLDITTRARKKATPMVEKDTHDEVKLHKDRCRHESTAQ